MKLINKQNYNEKIKVNRRAIGCYDKKMLDELYPNNNYSIVGETFENNKKKEIDTIVLANKIFPVSEYGKNSKILYKRKGYLAVDKDQFVVFLQSRLAFFLILFGIITIGIGFGILWFNSLVKGPVVAPDYPLPPEDSNATDIKNDSTKESDTSHKNHASIKVAREVNVFLNRRKVEFIYQNLNASNKDAVVSLCVLKDDNEYVIARSGLIKSGKEIKIMELLKDAIKLSEGIYKGRIIIDFYDENTGEKAAASTNFEDVDITVK